MPILVLPSNSLILSALIFVFTSWRTERGEHSTHLCQNVLETALFNESPWKHCLEMSVPSVWAIFRMYVQCLILIRILWGMNTPHRCEMSAVLGGKQSHVVFPGVFYRTDFCEIVLIYYSYSFNLLSLASSMVFCCYFAWINTELNSLQLCMHLKQYLEY